ncbi:chloroplast envelope protein translocase family [Micromonas pusilla CCMP1545]|uniref:Chloroplast envelope protein translocase family n=1 Tax=Micromonas pusilla (strain CCMP1545) TaxID=564608 RepID=C1MTS4_MICPC|nr:chloroplast envelope protein translocase family [Micromonas pusilla CCMP1545]EEH56501.1 chloroplast envelope protein translocase family [Micromonas pusilla CCMP1545]|eukprot:XP_003059369.1 chloroplast envelope protein translocase family [Micromonas pusilla CCMP1545]
MACVARASFAAFASSSSSSSIPKTGKGGSFVDHCHGVEIKGGGASATDEGAGGVLSGLTFAVKDNLDLAGHRTGCGNPDWLRTRGGTPAATHAPCVAAMLDAGATCVGKTQMDELAWSLQGENAHYGTPSNPADPSRVPGGSSSGSACAVAAAHVDVALGTDTAGSVRVPASYVGVYGFRPSHGRVPVDGCVALARSFDCVGWFARDAATLMACGAALLPPDRPSGTIHADGFKRLIVATDAFATCDAGTREALISAIERAAKAGGDLEPAWWDSFRTLQTREVWLEHGAWIEETDPSFGPGVAERFAAAEAGGGAATDAIAAANAARDAITRRLNAMLEGGGVIVLPSAPSPALKTGASAEATEAFRARQLRLTTAAGMAGLPQARRFGRRIVSIPAATADGAPVGLSFIAARGRDEELLALTVSLERALF